MDLVIRTLLKDFREGLSLPPGAPRLTWYGPDGERVELSGKVLDNWVAKTANFLQDELDAAPGGSIALDLPGHWKSSVLALAALNLGLTVRPGTPGDDEELSASDLVATADAGLLERAGEVDTQLVAVSLGALAPRWPGTLPAGVVDYAAEVRSHGDVFLPWMDPTGQEMLLVSEDQAYDDAGLPAFATPTEQGARVLVHAADGLTSVLAHSLGAWLAGGSVVLVHESVPVTERLLESERVTSGGARDA